MDKLAAEEFCVITDNNGEWKRGFMIPTSSRNAAETELLAIFHGLEWAWKRGLRRLEVQCDSEDAINWIRGVTTTNDPMLNYVDKCKRLLTKQWDVRLLHVLREKNMAADAMTKEARAYMGTFGDIQIPPTSVVHRIEEDCIGRTWQRWSIERNS
ncbi:PREDICTED: uncharacterized protein LOC109154167 [Ipomoea nil]|uniref:uncharacterized protein LOC109154167 n=1 Tax=Ipomoea nil TaxID=35883 RepID=UPI000900BF9D|nr:PREDICTED: uncharacterized protein LOC109154167 [Ipomoea nil]